MRVVINVEPRFLGRFEARFARNMRNRRIAKALRAGGREVTRRLRSASWAVYYQGAYREGWIAVPHGPTQLIITNKAPNFPYVEFGRRPGTWPPHTPILKWVLAKGMSANAVWPVKAKIRYKGIAARPLLVKPQVQKMIERMMQKHMLRFVDKALMTAAR